MVCAVTLGALIFGGAAYSSYGVATPDLPTIAGGEIGTGVDLTPPPVIPKGYTAAESQCEGDLAEARSRLPFDYGTEWFWADLRDQAFGLYFPIQNKVILSTVMPCKYVAAVAAHEWAHQVQDVTGLQDPTMINGYPKSEIVAECTARVIADREGWTYYPSYPELTSTPCTEVNADVEALLALV